MMTNEWRKKREKNANQRSDSAQSAILERDFDKLGRIAMDDCDEFIQCCNETVIYEEEIEIDSKKQKEDEQKQEMKADIRSEIVKIFNESQKGSDNKIKCFYTFDAGPNAVLFVEEENTQKFLEFLYLESGIVQVNINDEEKEGKERLVDYETQFVSKDIQQLHFVEDLRQRLKTKDKTVLKSEIRQQETNNFILKITHTHPGPPPQLSVLYE
ncbi:MAG: hypothetical protein EZS28_016065 [Streblomastix strix]|uniref:Mvd1 C-terminal domain-containing protein n=1 Tax=Streblomastix strix TaxID=222440 RepID=A0A5J4W1K5_9EUKA|nr:MAG: hypothetical protein EZS28_016065 [Streblomastix strix]